MLVLGMPVSATATEPAAAAPPVAESEVPSAGGGTAAIRRELVELQAALDELDQRGRIVERKVELDQETRTADAKKAAVPVAGEAGFVLRSADGRFQVRIGAVMQADSRWLPGDDSRKAADSFLLRRVRPDITGTLSNFVNFRLMPDFGEGKAQLVDAYLDVHPRSWHRLRAGKFKPPFGQERLQSTKALVFVERGLTTNLAPNRDVGVQLYGELAGGVVGWTVGAFDGAADLASLDGDTNDEKDLAVRLVVRPFAAAESETLSGLGIGVAGTLGTSDGKPEAPGLASYKSPAQNTVFSYRSDTKAPTEANTVVAAGERRRISPQLFWYAGPFGLLADYVLSTQEVKAGTKRNTLDHEAWSVAASFSLAGDKVTYDGIRPLHGLDSPQPGAGAWEIGLRYGELRADRASFPAFADPAKSASEAREVGAAVNWYPSRTWRVGVNFERTDFKGGAKAGDRPSENAVLTRLQAAF